LYAEELAERLPEGVDCIYFASSGSEANAMATQFARMHTGNFPILTLKNGYHGHGGTQHLTNIGSWNHAPPRTQGVEATCFPDLFRGPFSPEEAPKGYGDQVKEAIDFNTPGQVALFMAEAIQGVGGLNPLPQGFMQHAIPHVKAAGGLVLSDEVQTGFGRVGSHYWGCDMLGYKPDIITMAKQMGNGFPLAAVACSKEVASSLNKLTFSTYGANPSAMAAGREVLQVIDDEGMQENSARCGAMLKEGLLDMKSRY
jgi:alanine-glyoxylate transaminase/(R)-3-amino-2-methylpropionate-pyruvate transaminase